MRDFTLEAYDFLLNALGDAGFFTVCDYLDKKPVTGIILRHDVDVDAGKALRMARLEEEHGVKSTYYFRFPKTFNEKVVGEVAGLGHEIGYHYETVDKAGGELEKAAEMFSRELEAMRGEFDVRTASMHGGVLTRHDNRELWTIREPSDYGLTGEAYLSIDYSKVHYFTDTGRTWADRYAVKDLVEEKSPLSPGIHSTFNLVKTLREKQGIMACLVTHPKRWSAAVPEWCWELGLQSAKNVGKQLINYGRHISSHKK